MHETPDTCDSEAIAIYQAHLDWMTSALLSGDFDAFTSRLCYPHFVTTLSDSFKVASIEENLPIFESLHECLKNECVTDLIRIAQHAAFVAPGELIGLHETHKMHDGKRLAAPYKNRMRLVRCPDTIWRETHSANAITNKAGKFSIPVPSGHLADAPDLKLNTEGH